MKYRISVCGCDDSTHFDMELTQKEYQLIKKVAILCTEKSEYNCMPTMEIKIKENKS